MILEGTLKAEKSWWNNWKYRYWWTIYDTFCCQNYKDVIVVVDIKDYDSIIEN